MSDDQVTSVSESNISALTRSVSHHVMSSCLSLTHVSWSTLQSSVSRSTHPVSRWCPVQASRPTNPDVENRLFSSSPVPEMFRGPAARWDDRRNVVAVQLSDHHRLQLPLHHQRLLHVPQPVIRSILPLSLNIEPTDVIDVNIHMMNLFVHFYVCTYLVVSFWGDLLSYPR